MPRSLCFSEERYSVAWEGPCGLDPFRTWQVAPSSWCILPGLCVRPSCFQLFGLSFWSHSCASGTLFVRAGAGRDCLAGSSRSGLLVAAPLEPPEPVGLSPCGFPPHDCSPQVCWLLAPWLSLLPGPRAVPNLRQPTSSGPGLACACCTVCGLWRTACFPVFGI